MTQPLRISVLVRLGLCSLAYFLAQELAFMFPGSFGLISAIWPAAGIALATLLLSPRRLWGQLLGCLFVSGMAANLTTDRPVLVSLGFMVANLAETAASAWLITRLCGERVGFNRVREIVGLICAVVLVNGGTTLIATETAQLASGAPFWRFYWTWWVADGLGLLLVTPLIVVWVRSLGMPPRTGYARLAEATVLIALASVVAGMEFGWTQEFSVVQIAPLWLPVFLIWSSLRLGPRATVTLLAAFAVVAIGCTVAGRGSFPLGGANAALQLLTVQTYLGVMGLSGLLLAASAAEQKASQALLKAVVESTTDAIYIKDRHGRYLLMNPAAARFVGKTPAEVIGKDDTELFPAAEAQSIMAEDKVTMAAPASRTYEEQVTGGAGQSLVFSSTKGPLRDETGATIGLFGIARDITIQRQVEQALRKSEQKFSTIFHDAPVQIGITDLASGAFVDLNDELVRASGFTREELNGHTAVELGWISATDRAKLAREVSEHGRVTGLQLELTSKNGDHHQCLVNGEQITIADRLCLLTFTVDITRLKQAKDALRESEERYQRITEAITDYIYTVRVADGRAVETTHGPGCLAVTGYVEADFASNPCLWLDMVVAGDRPIVEEQAKRILGGEDPPPLEHRLTRKDGDVRWVSNTCVPHRNEQGRLESYDGLVQDITTSKMAKLALQLSEAQYRQLFEGMLDGFAVHEIICDPPGNPVDYRFLSVNPAFERLTGLRAAEVVGRTVREVMPATEEHWIERYGRVALTGEGIEFEQYSSALQRHFEIAAFRPQPGQFATVFIDITERKRAEIALRESNYLLQKAHEIAHLGSYKWDIVTGRWTSSAKLDEIFGIGPGYDRDLAGWLKLIAPTHREEMAAYVRDHVIGGRRLFDREYPIIRASDQQQRWVAGMGEMEWSAAGEPVLMIGSIQDITDRRQAEARLRLQGDALDAAANAIVITNRAGVIEWANAAFTTFTGYTAAEAIGLKPGELLNSGRHKPAFFGNMWATIVAGEVWHGEIVNRRKDGSLYQEEMTITPMAAPSGEVTHFIAVKQDITRRKSLEAQLLQSQKMEAIGLLAGGVAHDFNNILAAVLLYLGLLQDEPAVSPDTRASLVQLEKEVRRGASLTRQLLALSRKQAMEPRGLNLNSVVVNLTKMLHRVLGEQITIVHERPDIPMLTEADEGMIEQVVLNLCINARDAMPKGGALSLSITEEEVTPARAEATLGARSGRFVCLGIRDTGTGMDAETQARIFEPFFTTKEAGKGTGLGLAIVQGIVQQHQGWIEVESRRGHGTTFRVFLPAGDPDKPVHRQDAPRPLLEAGRGEAVLVAEDETSLRTVIGMVLRQNGYEVFEAANGPQAVECWQQHSARITLLITDMVMPGGMSGSDLIEQLGREKPSLRVLVCTGYSQPVEMEKLRIDPQIALLRKPFDIPTLLVRVRQALDRN